MKIFKHFGFEESRQKGSHVAMAKPGVSRPLIIPMHAKAVPIFIILNNIRSAGISRDEYLRIPGAL
ncbi:MAG: type II toxin-antitoxin system HicA family toxin [Elusimicrobia bacterium]|nr:type II toxin-antitoxin system HicA family toxin [Elusimicrobiota bacterium]